MKGIQSEEELYEVFDQLDKAIETEVSAYLLGGGAMMTRGEKPLTKDVDIAGASREGFEALAGAAFEAGFSERKDPPHAYEFLGAGLLLERNGVGLDVFDRAVAGKLRISDGMRERSETVYEGAMLTVAAVSNTDIFLFKAVANRGNDIKDMRRLALRTEYGLVADEIRAQRPMAHGPSGRKRLQPPASTKPHPPSMLLQDALNKLGKEYQITEDLEGAVEEARDACATYTEIVHAVQRGCQTRDGISEFVGQDVNDSVDELVEADVLEQKKSKLRLTEE